MSPPKDVHKAVSNCTVHLWSNYGGKYRIPERAENPFKMDYNLELNTSPELDPDTASHYLTIICVLR